MFFLIFTIIFLPSFSSFGYENNKRVECSYFRTEESCRKIKDFYKNHFSKTMSNGLRHLAGDVTNRDRNSFSNTFDICEIEPDFDTCKNRKIKADENEKK